MKKLQLTQNDLEFICPMKVEDMTTVDGGYYCAKCELKVHDVSNCSVDDFQALKSQNSNVCVTFKKIVTLGAMLSFSACTPAHITDKVTANTKDEAKCVKVVSGESNNTLRPFSGVNPNEEFGVHIAGGYLL